MNLHTDTSDEAMSSFANERERIGDKYLMGSQAYGDGIEIGWEECRRRCEAQIEQLQSEVVAAIDERHYAENRLKAQMEERERKAFEAGFLARLVKNWNSEEAYRAYKSD